MKDDHKAKQNSQGTAKNSSSVRNAEVIVRENEYGLWSPEGRGDMNSFTDISENYKKK